MHYMSMLLGILTTAHMIKCQLYLYPPYKNQTQYHMTHRSHWALCRLRVICTSSQLRFWRRLLQENSCWIIGINIPACNELFQDMEDVIQSLQYKRAERVNACICWTYACLIILSTGVWAACKGSMRGSGLGVAWAICWLYCLTEAIRFKKRGTKVPQPPSLNKILKEWVE